MGWELCNSFYNGETQKQIATNSTSTRFVITDRLYSRFATIYVSIDTSEYTFYISGKPAKIIFNQPSNPRKYSLSNAENVDAISARYKTYTATEQKKMDEAS